MASKRSIVNVFEGIGIDYGEEALDKLKFNIYDLIIKSLSMATSQVSHLIRSCHADDVEN